MRRRKRKSNALVIAVYSAILVICMTGVGWAIVENIDKAIADKQGCYSGMAQAHTIALVDASIPRWDTVQRRALHRYFQDLFEELTFNERLAVYTTEGDQMASVLAPRFHVCGPAKRADDLIAIGADAGITGYLAKQRKRLYERVLRPELEALFSDNPDNTR